MDSELAPFLRGLTEVSAIRSWTSSQFYFFGLRMRSALYFAKLVEPGMQNRYLGALHVQLHDRVALQRLLEALRFDAVRGSRAAAGAESSIYERLCAILDDHRALPQFEASQRSTLHISRICTGWTCSLASQLNAFFQGYDAAPPGGIFWRTVRVEETHGS